MSIKSELEKFGRNYDDGECSYCPSTSEDCKKCKKMIKAHQAILAEFERMIPERKPVEKIPYSSCSGSGSIGLNKIGKQECIVKVEQQYLENKHIEWNDCLDIIKAKLHSEGL